MTDLLKREITTDYTTWRMLQSMCGEGVTPSRMISRLIQQEALGRLKSTARISAGSPLVSQAPTE